MSETDENQKATVVKTLVASDRPRPGMAVCEACGDAEASPPMPAKPTKDGQPVARGYCEACKDEARARNDAEAAERAKAFVPTVEHWAREKGMLPELITPPVPEGAKPTKVMGRVHNPRFALFAAAKHLHGWPEGREMSEEEFDDAIRAANTPSENTFR